MLPVPEITSKLLAVRSETCIIRSQLTDLRDQFLHISHFLRFRTHLQQIKVNMTQ